METPPSRGGRALPLSAGDLARHPAFRYPLAPMPTTEKDSLGEVSVPDEALWGAQTQRAVDNFPVSGRPLPPAFLRALAVLKQAAAKANAELGLLDPKLAGAIAEAAQEIIDGKWDDQFPIDVFHYSNLHQHEPHEYCSTYIRRLGKAQHLVFPTRNLASLQRQTPPQLTCGFTTGHPAAGAGDPRTALAKAKAFDLSALAGPICRTPPRAPGSGLRRYLPSPPRHGTIGARRIWKNRLAALLGTGLNAHPQFAEGLRPRSATGLNPGGLQPLRGPGVRCHGLGAGP